MITFVFILLSLISLQVSCSERNVESKLPDQSNQTRNDIIVCADELCRGSMTFCTALTLKLLSVGGFEDDQKIVLGRSLGNTSDMNTRVVKMANNSHKKMIVINQRFNLPQEQLRFGLASTAMSINIRLFEILQLVPNLTYENVSAIIANIIDNPEFSMMQQFNYFMGPMRSLYLILKQYPVGTKGYSLRAQVLYGAAIVISIWNKLKSNNHDAIKVVREQSLELIKEVELNMCNALATLCGVGNYHEFYLNISGPAIDEVSERDIELIINGAQSRLLESAQSTRI